MMPRSNPIHIPPHLRGDADADTLAELVQSSRRMGAFWPLLTAAVAAPAPAHRAGLGFRVSAHSADLVRELSEYGA